MEKTYEYILNQTSYESYGEIKNTILKTYSRQKAIDRMKKEALWLMTNDGYQNIKDHEPEDMLTIIKTGSRIRFNIETVEVDFEGAPWYTPVEDTTVEESKENEE